MITRSSYLALLLLGAPFASAFSAPFDWPQWQGPDRDAVSKEKGLLQEWPKDGPPVAWRINGIGGGYSAPAIVEGRIYGMSSRGDDEVVWALSETDGKEVWATTTAKALKEGFPQGVEGAGCTPTVDGDRLYVLGLGGELACLQAKDGKILWKHNLVTDFGGALPSWRYNESPLVDGDKIICTPGGKESAMVALDKMTGNALWKNQVPDAAAVAGGPGGPGGPGGGGPGGPGGRGNFTPPSAMQTQPVLAALDADKNKEISAEELTGAPAALAPLDKNKDGKITEDELQPPQPAGNASPGGGPDRPRRNRGGGMMRFLPVLSALDADKNGGIDDAEIKNAAVALRTLDKNTDGKLVEAEVTPQFGNGGGMGMVSSEAGYSSAIAIDYGGQRQYVQMLSKALVGVGAADGKLLWRYDKPSNSMKITCSTPLYYDGQVFAASAYNSGGGLAKLSKDESGGWKAEEVWFSKDMENHHGGVILFDGCLYGSNGGNGGGYLACLDFKTGETLWNERDNDKRRARKGSVAMADERLYLRTEEGDVLLIEPSRKEYLERGRFVQPDRTRQPAWTHPVIANGKLYIRDQDDLFCYDVKSPK